MEQRKSLRELGSLLKVKKSDIEDSMKTFESSDNPQVVNMYIKLSGELRIIENVLEYIETGSKSLLKVYK